MGEKRKKVQPKVREAFKVSELELLKMNFHSDFLSRE